jgi:ankyrin repeat protein
VQALVHRGAEIDAFGRDGWTALGIAEFDKSKEASQLLQARGACSESGANAAHLTSSKGNQSTKLGFRSSEAAQTNRFSDAKKFATRPFAMNVIS